VRSAGGPIFPAPADRGKVRTVTAIRIASVQLAPAIGEPEANRARSVAAIDAACAAGATLVVLPELTSSGYVFADRDEAAGLAEDAAGPTVTAWAAAAARHRAVVVGGFCEAGDGGTLHNSAAVVDASGVRAVYRKLHLWDREKLVFSPGAEPAPVVDTPVGRLGVGICYDIAFPELTRGLAIAGADAMVFPTNSTLPDGAAGPRPDVALAVATAYVNRVWVVVADRCGVERGVTWAGASLVVDPLGAVVAGPGEPETPATLLADGDLTLARDKSWGERNDLFGDRRVDAYRP
jgi:predicted amidohydrolase